MTEVVILEDMVAGYNTTWARVANTTGSDKIKPGDEFREQGALEEFRVEATAFSPIPGASKLFLQRGHHSTRPEVHKTGAVLMQLNIVAAAANGRLAESAIATPLAGTTAVTVSTQAQNTAVGIAEREPDPDPLEAFVNPQVIKRGRGRPAGSKNKPKQTMQPPAWPGV